MVSKRVESLSLLSWNLLEPKNWGIMKRKKVENMENGRQVKKRNSRNFYFKVKTHGYSVLQKWRTRHAIWMKGAGSRRDQRACTEHPG